MSDSKIITILGKTNVDNITLKKVDRIRLCAVDEEFIKEQELTMLFEIKDSKKSENSSVCRREISNKLTSYKSQDVKKDKYEQSVHISMKDTINKLLLSELNCSYCSERVKLMYMKVRDPKQWTLDRINNDLSHSNKNTVISCLSCNIKRGLINKDKFEFTKKMVIVKTNW